MSKEYLPGDPTNALVRKVKRHLCSYGIRPHRKFWRLAWTWAAKVARSYQFSDRYINGAAKTLGMKPFMPKRPRWPSPSEIGAQYVVLMLAEMRDDHALKIPYRAQEEMPVEVSVALTPLAQRLAALPAAKPSLPMLEE